MTIKLPDGTVKPAIVSNDDAQIEDLALRGAKAINEMATETQDAMMSAVPGTAKAIGQSFHGRLLRRRTDELAKLIGQTHLDTTTETSGRVADLKVAMTDGDVRKTATALADIAKTSGTSLALFERFVDRLELINDAAKTGALAMIPGPLRLKIQSLGDGEVANLPRIAGEALSQMAFKPLQDAVDT